MPAVTRRAQPASRTAPPATAESALGGAQACGPQPCRHKPACPGADAPDRYRAHVLAAHPEQGWSLLCNGVIAFDDLGGLLPGRIPIPALRRAG